MDILLGLVSFLTGVTVIIQSAVNGRLRSMTANPIFSSAASLLPQTRQRKKTERKRKRSRAKKTPKS